MTLSHKGQIGVSQQSTLGTSVTATKLIPVTSFSMEEVTAQILDNGRRGPHSMDFRAVTGVKQYNISFDSLVQFNGTTGTGLGVLLRNILGTGAVSASLMVSPATYNHDFQLAASSSNKDYITLEDDTSLSGKAREIEGCRVTDLTISWNAGEGALAYNATLIGRDITDPLISGAGLGTLQDTTIEDPIQGWRAVVAFNQTHVWAGTSLNKRLISCEWTLSRASRLMYSGSNSQLYQDLYLGPLQVTVSMVLDYIDDTELALYRTGNAIPLVNSFVYGSYGDTTLRRFAIGAPSVSLLEAPAVLDTSGEVITLGMSGRCLYTNDASVIVLDAGVGTDTAVPTMTGPVHIRMTDLMSAAF